MHLHLQIKACTQGFCICPVCLLLASCTSTWASCSLSPLICHALLCSLVSGVAPAPPYCCLHDPWSLCLPDPHAQGAEMTTDASLWFCPVSLEACCLSACFRTLCMMASRNARARKVQSNQMHSRAYQSSQASVMCSMLLACVQYWKCADAFLKHILKHIVKHSVKPSVKPRYSACC